MALGFGVLRMAPAQFWAMSVSELNAALKGLTGEAWAETPISRHHFGVLMDRYPDHLENSQEI